MHVLLGVFQVAAAEVFLHHVLVKAGHDNGDEDAAQKLFPEERFLCWIIEEPHACIVGVADFANYTAQA